MNDVAELCALMKAFRARAVTYVLCVTLAVLFCSPPVAAQSPERVIRLNVPENLRPCFRDAQRFVTDQLRDFSVGDRLRVSIGDGPSAELDASLLRIACTELYEAARYDYEAKGAISSDRFATMSLWLLNTELPEAIVLEGSRLARQQGDAAFSLIYLHSAAEALFALAADCGLVDWVKYYDIEVCPPHKARRLVRRFADEMAVDIEKLTQSQTEDAFLEEMRVRQAALAGWAGE